jgi:CRISPR-associated protein Cas2
MPSTNSTTTTTTTCYLIAYDIPDDRHRTKVHKVLSGFGKWTQYSIFECFLTKKEFITLKTKLAKHISPERDSVRFYPICQNCLPKVETVGGKPPSEDMVFIL